MSTKGLGLVSILASWTAGNALHAQVRTEWPVMKGTPANTRFADIANPAAPTGIRWRRPFPTDPTYVISPVLSQDLMILGTSALSGANHGTRILDAQTGQTLYVLKLSGSGTSQAVGEAVLEDGQTHRMLFLQAMEPTPISGEYTWSTCAYDLGKRPLLAETPWTPAWVRVETRAGVRALLNYRNDSLYVRNPVALLTLDARDGSLQWKRMWSDTFDVEGGAALGEIREDHVLTPLVIMAGKQGVTALDSATGNEPRRSRSTTWRRWLMILPSASLHSPCTGYHLTPLRCGVETSIPTDL